MAFSRSTRPLPVHSPGSTQADDASIAAPSVSNPLSPALWSDYRSRLQYQLQRQYGLNVEDLLTNQDLITAWHTQQSVPELIEALARKYHLTPISDTGWPAFEEYRR